MPTYEEAQGLLLQAETALSKIESDAEANSAQLAHAATAIKAVDVLLLQAGMAVMVCVSYALTLCACLSLSLRCLPSARVFAAWLAACRTPPPDRQAHLVHHPALTQVLQPMYSPCVCLSRTLSLQLPE